MNVTRFYLNSGLLNYSGIVFNQSLDWYQNRWTQANATTDIRYPGIQTSIATSDINNTFLENGSYFRLKTLTLSYTLPSLRVIKNPRLFFTGTNLFTITKYTGFDPEVSSYGQSLLQQGIDFGAYPASKTYTIGFACSLLNKKSNFLYEIENIVSDSNRCNGFCCIVLQKIIRGRAVLIFVFF